MNSVPELYAHALAVEREAAVRYREFAQWMHDLGIDHVAVLFDHLQEEEAKHLRRLEQETDGMPLPELSPWQYAWLFTSLPDTIEQAFPLMPQNTRDALAFALAAERRAQRFFDTVASEAEDQAVRELASEMLAEECQHIEEIEHQLEIEPDPAVDWNLVYEGTRARPELRA
ncbi:MAG: ferritin family protein [Betaproteobacteria bacterium]|nr:ferritin family protein [Betaproteobacteria bacterium]